MANNIGWECPKCGRCHAPFVLECIKCWEKKETEQNPFGFTCAHLNSYSTFDNAPGGGIPPMRRYCPDCKKSW